MPNSIHSLLMMMSITTRPKTSPGLPSFTLLRCLIMSLESKHHIWPGSGPFIRVSIAFYFQELFILIANLRIQIETFFHIYDLSIGSTETKYIKLNTKTQFLKITFDFCIHFKRELFFSFCFLEVYKKLIKFSFKQQKIFWVLVFSFMYLVLVDVMDRSYEEKSIVV